MATYRISDWDSRYEVSAKGREWSAGEAKRVGPLEYIRLKVHGYSQGVGWRKLIATVGIRKAPGIFGIFCKFLELAADAQRDTRGTFSDTEDTPLSFVLGLDDSDVKSALEACCKLNWIQKEESSKEENNQDKTTQLNTSVPDTPGTSRKNPGRVHVEKIQFLEFVRLTADEYKKLVTQFGEAGAQERIQALNDGIGSKGYKYQSHYHTILSWERKHQREKAANAPIPFDPEATTKRLMEKGLI